MLLEHSDPECRSAGSFFKNPTLPAAQATALERQLGVSPPRFPASDGLVKIPAAWLLEQSGFHKGHRSSTGKVGLSSRHVLAIVNYGAGRAAEVVALARQIQAAVSERCGGIWLQPEPVQVGFGPGEGIPAASTAVRGD